MTEMISLGRIVKTFGLLGGVFVKFFNKASETIKPNMYVYVGVSKDKAKKMAVEKIVPGGRLFFSGITDMEAARSLIGLEVFVDRENFPNLSTDDEYYLTDILGASCYDTEGNMLGMLSGFSNNGAQLLLEIK